jgi:hypothetical protein
VVTVGSGEGLTRFTVRDGEIVSEAGTVVASFWRFGRTRQMMKILVGSKSYYSRSFWHPHTLQETDTGRTVIVFKRRWFSLRFRLVFPTGESLRASSTSRAIGGRLSLSDKRGVVIEVIPSDGAPSAGARDQRRYPSTHVVVYREGIPDLLLVIALAVNLVGETRRVPAVSGGGFVGG